MSTSDKAYHINISSDNKSQSLDSDIFENYIIISNKELKSENDELKNHLKDYEHKVSELEDELSREEISKRYMKGLMHNLYDMKKKNDQVSEKYDFLNKKFYNYTKNFNKSFSNIPLSILHSVNYFHNYILFYIISGPVISYLINIINFSSLIVIVLYQLLPLASLYVYFKYNSKNYLNNDYNFDNIDKVYFDSLSIIMENKKEINKIEDACRCLDEYIDNI